LELAQYREKAAFAQFGSDLDAATQRQIARGQRLTEILKQGQYVPMPVERQVVVIFAATQGFLDKYPTASMRKYEDQLFAFLDRKYPEIFSAILSTGKLEGEAKAKLESALKEFGGTFVA
jgi:F-type H+-transporting ATPase subunit alpha